MIVNISNLADAGALPTTAESEQRRSSSFSIRRWLREPLLHFLVLGAALFVVYGHLPASGAESPRQISLTVDDLRQLMVSFEAQWGRAPTQQEFSHLAEEKIQEEVLYREALALGLDKDDTIVKRRMAQKMQFLAEDVVTAHEPSIDELKTWYAQNSQKFELPSRIAFRHLYLSPDQRGQRAHDDAVKALAKLTGQPEDSKLASSLADPFMSQDYYRDRTSEEMAKEFGPQFALAIFKLKPGSWQGPIESGYGWHLVFVDGVIPGRIPAFEEVESDVKTAWLGEQKEEAWRKAYQAMRAKYTVSLPNFQDQAAVTTLTQPAKREIPAPSGEGPE